MSKFVNRIFKQKKSSSRTLDDVDSSSALKNGKHSTLPRSKTTHLPTANGRSPSPPMLVHNNHYDHQKEIPGVSLTKNSSSVRSPPPPPPSNGHVELAEYISPMEIPVEEALQMIAEDPPIVARCTPKGMEMVDTQRWKDEHEMQHCIYEKAVYEKMIASSLKTCELLQKDLDSYITVVRQTPSREISPLKHE